MSQAIDVVSAPLEAILALREQYRREMACQIVHDSWHARGFTDSYVLQAGGNVVGYGSVGGPPRAARDIVKEFYLRPESRGLALPLFRRLVEVSGARTVEAQTNDILLTLMLFDVTTGVESAMVLFDDAVTTTLRARAVMLRRITEADRVRVFEHTVEPVGDWGLERDGQIVATGGFFTHYNPPYGDIYMEVWGPHRRQGLGSFLVQELKRICREGGLVPAARCHQTNTASRRTLQRAGMFPCARIIRGRIGYIFPATSTSVR